MNKILTIIIPTYNMEKYLNRCLDSLIVSGELMEKLEILIINDGSKDNSSCIAHMYEEKFPNTYKVIDKENGNYGSCINCGLTRATGKYVKVLDADDWFDTVSFENLINCLCKMDVDMVLTLRTCYYENKNKYIKDQLFKYPPNTVMPFNVFLKDKSTSLGLQMHWVLYRTSLLKSIRYKQTEGVSYTDIEWIFIPLSVVESIVYIPIYLYTYLIGREGQTVDPKVLARSNNQLLVVIKRLVNEYEELSKVSDSHHSQYLTGTLKRLIGVLYFRYLILSNDLSKDLMKFDQNLKTNKYLYDSTNDIRHPFNLPLIRVYRNNKYTVPVSFIIRFKIYKSISSIRNWFR